MMSVRALDIWRETVSVRFGHIDRSDRLTLGSIFNFFQDAAISHAENLGVDRDVMAKTGQVWVISRLSVFVERRPRYREVLTVRSWPRGWEKLFALRDYDIRDSSDRVVVRGRSGWLILDMEKRRPLRVQQIMENMPLNEGEDAFVVPPDQPRSPLGLAARENLRKAGERRALYSDVDYNGHVNNVRYIQWIEDIAGPELLENAGALRLDINYLGEVTAGELTELWSAPLPGAFEGDYYPGPAASGAAFAYEGRRAGQAGEQPVFRAELRTAAGGNVPDIFFSL
jgi:acyl-ACP thioesterase